MKIREMILPRGWYPDNAHAIADFLKRHPQKAASEDKGIVSAFAPHAGWFYSGICAAKAISALDADCQTIAVIGGHLSAMPLLMAEEEAVSTPLGIMEIDAELRDEFALALKRDKIEYAGDSYSDNTVEVLLPMVKHYFPHAKLLWLRFSALLSSYDAGILLASCAKKLNRKLALIASSDLTHYGVNYNFSPMGRGKVALDWVMNVNDKKILDAVLSDDAALVLKCAQEDYSSCSAGALLGAMAFSRGKKARLLDYRTSAAAMEGREVPDSFVGYASMIWE